MKKVLETSRGRFVVIQKTSENSYPLDIWMSHYYPLIRYKEYYKLSEITELEASSIVDETIMYQRLKSHTYKYRSYINGFLGFDTAIDSLHSLLESQGIEITNNTHIFKI